VARSGQTTGGSLPIEWVISLLSVDVECGK
jgi:hypothetical protein